MRFMPVALRDGHAGRLIHDQHVLRRQALALESFAVPHPRRAVSSCQSRVRSRLESTTLRSSCPNGSTVLRFRSGFVSILLAPAWQANLRGSAIRTGSRGLAAAHERLTFSKQMASSTAIGRSTERFNARGTIDPERVLELIGGLPQDPVELRLERLDPFEAPDEQAVRDLRESVECGLPSVEKLGIRVRAETGR